MAINPFTLRKRAVQYARRNFAADITEKQKANHLNAVLILNRVKRGLPRLEKTKDPRAVKDLKKALFVSRMAAKLTDAAIDAQIGVVKFEQMSERDRHWTWNNTYESAVAGLKKRPFIKEDPVLVKNINFLENFFTLPQKIHRIREKHWKIISKVKEKSRITNHDPKIGLAKEMDRLLSRKRDHEPLKAKAMDVCIAASIYADIMEERGENWSRAYQDGMEIAFTKIRENQELVDTIASM